MFYIYIKTGEHLINHTEKIKLDLHPTLYIKKQVSLNYSNKCKITVR